MKEKVWHREAISAGMENILRELHQQSLLENFYLAGETGLALHLGHRRSVDLDFFSRELFNEEILLQKAQRLSGFSLVAREAHTLHAHIQGNRVSFLGYAYPVLFPFEVFGNVPVADLRDIACRKISAIASRGTKRDFIDLYVVSKQYGLSHLLDLFKSKYAQAQYSIVHILKSLVYFEDAEKDPMPDMLAAISWEQVKRFFIFWLPRL